MINLRYHIVSITAVFLALGIGVALGSTLIERATVDNLNRRLDEQAERLDRTDGENAMLREELATIDARERQLTVEGMSLYAGHLDAVPVVVLTVQGVDDDLHDLTRTSLRAAGATVHGTLRFTQRWEQLDEGEVAELSELTGRTFNDAAAARNRVLRDLADELLTAAEPAPPEPEPEPEPPLEEGVEGVADPTTIGTPEVPADQGAGQGTEGGEIVPAQEGDEPTTTTTVPPEPNGLLLAGLVERGYLEFLPDGSGLPLPEFEARYVVVADADADVDHGAALLPLLGFMSAADPAPVVVAEPLPEPEVDPADDDGGPVLPGALVAAIRDDDALRMSMTTTDVAGRFIGQAAIVLGVADLVGGSPQVGHYGMAAGATTLVPPAAG